MMAGAGASPYELASDAASRLGIAVGAEELATLASDLDLGDGEMAAVAATFSYLAEKRRLASIETLLRLSRLPRREPKTFEGFDFSRIRGRDAAALGKLPSLADLYAHRNVAFVGPGGIGKTHLAQAYGRECCMRGLKTYYIKATELRDRFQKAVQRGNTSRVVSSLVKPSCLIVDEVGRCVYDRPCTDLFFDVVDRRYEKEGPNAMVLTSNIAPSGWDEFFTGDDTLLCALDRLFDKASVFVMRGPSYRGRGLDTYSVEAVPQAVKVRVSPRPFRHHLYCESAPPPTRPNIAVRHRH
ncbi:MAG: ATP-binding protein [Collinsella sp.]